MATRYNYTGGIVTDGLVLHLDAAKRDSYPGSGTVLRDLTGSSITGSLINDPGFSGIAKDASIEFDGTNDWLNIPGGDTLVKGKTQFSMGVMVKFTSLSFLGVVIGVPSYGCTKNIVISTFEDGNLTFYNDDLITCRSVVLNEYLELNKWIYIMATFDGTTSTLHAIKDGTLTSQASTLVTGSSNNFDDYNVFSLMGRGNNFLGGYLGSAFVYDRALTASEISQNFNALRGRYGI
jgi:hypothetical protein